MNELRLLNSSLAETGNPNPYVVPAGYFDGFAEQVMKRIKNNSEVSDESESLSPLLSGISKQMPYSAPAGYFEGLEEKLMQAVRESADYQSAKEELESISPLLSQVSKQNPYSVPSGYFDSLNKNQQEAKVVSITSRKWFRYAAAAVVIGIISTVAIFFIAGNNIKPVGEQTAWEKVEKKIEDLSFEEIKDFVEFSDAGLNGSETAGLQPVKKDEIRELLQDVSDSELKEFLDQTSDGLDDISLLN